MWRGRRGTWTSAHAAPAGRDASCATLKCAPLPSARLRSGTRTPVATYAQVIGKRPEHGEAGLITEKAPQGGSQVLGMR